MTTSPPQLITNLLVLIHHGVHVLDPHSVNGAIEDQPLSLLGHVASVRRIIAGRAGWPVTVVAGGRGFATVAGELSPRFGGLVRVLPLGLQSYLLRRWDVGLEGPNTFRGGTWRCRVNMYIGLVWHLLERFW